MITAYKTITNTVLLCILTLAAVAQDQGAIQKGLASVTTSSIGAHVNFLASPLLEGRYTSEKGAMLASEYIATMLAHYDVQLAVTSSSGAKRSYFQNVNLFRYSVPTNLRMAIEAECETTIPTPNSDFFIYNKALYNGFSVSGQVVFVGYGLRLPEYGIDSYGQLDVRGKVVVILPATKKNLLATSLAARGLNNEKISAIQINQEEELKKRNPRAVVYLCPAEEVARRNQLRNPTISPFEDLMGVAPESNSASDLRIFLSKAMMAAALKQYGVALDSPIDIKSKAIQTRIKFSVSAEVSAAPLKDRNVLGVIHGEDTTRCIIVGAHYDHNGMFNGVIYPGADDNASGVAGVLMLAKAMKESGIKPSVSILFALWTGEEKGLVGSTYYVRNPVYPLTQTVMYVNYDMIGRNGLKDTAKLSANFFYAESFSRVKEIVEANNAKLGGILNLCGTPTKGGNSSDYGPFSDCHVPFMGWTTGNHPDFHKPTDTADKIDPEKIQWIVKLSFLNLLDLSKEFGKR